jgi:hypothetical protein
MIELLNFIKGSKPLGSILNLSEVKKWSGPVGSRFSHAGDTYVTVTSGTYLNVPEGFTKIFNLDNGNQAINITKIDWLGDYRAYADLLPFSGNSFRHPMVASSTGTDTTFPTSPSAFFPLNVNVTGDIFQYRQTVSPFLTIVKYYDAGQWVDDINTINSNSYVFGTLGATRTQFLDVITDNVRSTIIELVGIEYLDISSPTPVGADNLIYWFGPVDGKLDGNGDILYSEIRKATSTHWMTISDSGQGYY